MAFVDTYEFHASAGTGGDGVVRWCREKFRPNGGPAGGDGGRGGDFVIRAVRDITRLHRLTQTHKHEAENGTPGSKNSCTGRNGKAYVLELPMGSVVTRHSDGFQVELVQEDQEVVLLTGGDGGFGNEHFKDSTNQTPTQCTKGKIGQDSDISVELKLMADVGLVGLPNAGKTSLLNTLTEAGAKVADYPFTTLDPNLGVYFGFVLADIPGLIEGASVGKGLGHKFLRHISRTKALVHCISLEQDTAVVDYNTVRQELCSYENLGDKTEYVVLTKSDTCDRAQCEERVHAFEAATGVKVFATISILDDDSVREFGNKLTQTLQAVIEEE